MSVEHLELTTHLCETATPPAVGQRFIRDTFVRGLALRITSTGSKAFIVETWVNGRSRRTTLGKFPALSLPKAQKLAKELIGKFAAGTDVVLEKRKQKALDIALQQVFDEFLASRKNLKSLTIKDMNRAFRETFPDWLNMPLRKITPKMVEARHRLHGENHSEARANLAMRYLRAVFNFAMAAYLDEEDQPLITVNPVKRLSQTKAWYRVDRRQTVIKPHELGPWIKAVLGLPGVDIRDYFMVVLLTGMRRQEALNLTWGKVDLVGKTFTIVDPKNSKDHTLPLSDYLRELFTRRKAVAVSDYVFADSAGRRISNFRYAIARVENESGVSFCTHDLRRSFATIAESLDIPAYALKRLLNHANGADVTAGYIVANVERLREPMQKITDYVLKAAGIKETAEVIQLKQARS
ncbi:MAG: integrase family protein [Methylococcaceae bacterium]|nr:integrase family protein [Methylococcaceae bacterium]